MSRFHLVVALVALLVGASSPAQPTANESDVRAALVLRLAKYVTWPAGREPSATPPLAVCVFGSDPIATSLRSLAPAAARVAVRRIAGDSADLLECHVVVFAADAAGDVNYALARLAGQPVLTIGASERFARSGGMIGLVNRDGRIAFVVNNDAAKRARLAISSLLLQIATVVPGDAP